MHVLYISGTYMPSSGGAEISMFSLLRSLVERGIRVTVFTSTRVPQTKKFSEDVGIDVQHVTTASLTQALAGFCAANKVDLIVTQHLWSDLAILFAKKTGIPSIIFARSHYGNLDLSKGGEYGCNHIIANSVGVADFVSARWGRKASIVRSIVRLSDYLTEPGSQEFITIVNPIELKGGAIFRSIVEQLPDRKFLAVEGWANFRGPSGWDVDLFKEVCATFRDELWLPEEIDFSGLKNLTYKSATQDMKEVYAATRLLLVPSLCPESGPRVAIEAMVNGIPVIGSEVPGITETLSTSGVLIRDYRDPNAWVSAVRGMDNINCYRRVAESSKSYVASLDYSAEVKRCISIFEQVIQGGL